MALRCVISCSDAKDAALSFILGGNSNRVVWDECQLIWDSRGLVDTASDDEVAVFGAEGKVLTPENELVHFSIRHCLDFEPRPTYRLHAALERPGGLTSEKTFGNENIPLGDDQTYFQARVLDLTEQVKVMGLERAIKSFLTRSGKEAAFETTVVSQA